MTTSDNTRKIDRRLGKQLVKLADNDQWDKCLAILLERQRRVVNIGDDAPLVWLGAKTKDGDSLVHLASYAACEIDTSLKMRRMALECLELILEADASAVLEMASDGGSALHAAIAAASASTMEASIDNDMHELFSDDSDSDDSEVDNMWESDSDGEGDNIEEYCSIIPNRTKYADLSSDQVTSTAIRFLLQTDADPNKPMRNDISDDDMDEMELIYSREAILEQWTPFTLCLIWTALASMQSELTEANTVILPLTVLKAMLINGADPTCPMGANSPSNGAELVASCAHVFTTRIRCDLLCANEIDVKTEDEVISILECLQQMLQLYATTKVPELTREQAVAAALIANDPETAAKLLSDNHEDLGKYRSLLFSDILPMPQATWCAAGARQSWTILSACVALMATSSVKFLLSATSTTLSEGEAIQAIEVSFCNKGMAMDVMMNLCEIESNTQTRQQAQREMCASIADVVYPPNDCELAAKRQMFLDRLLLHACSNTWGTFTAIGVLLSLGADPDAESVASLVQSNFRPLHFVAANHNGRNGVVMAKVLIDAGADMNLLDAQGDSPLNMALKHENFLVVEYLWQASGQITLNSSSMAYDIGKAALACQSLPMLEQALASFKRSIDVLGVEKVEELLGHLLLACIDERSGFKSDNLVEAVSIILAPSKSTDSKVFGTQTPELLPTLERDDISKYTALHSMLRNDRGSDARLAVIEPLCNLARKREARNANETAVDWINLACDSKFGSYTALHLACALGCEKSIQTIVAFWSRRERTRLSGQSTIPPLIE